jgi:hypothetical protein
VEIQTSARPGKRTQRSSSSNLLEGFMIYEIYEIVNLVSRSIVGGDGVAGDIVGPFIVRVICGANVKAVGDQVHIRKCGWWSSKLGAQEQ